MIKNINTTNTTLLKIKLLLLTLFFSVVSWGQTYYAMSGGNYSQTFTNLSTSYPTNFNGLAILSTGTIPVATKTTTATNSTLAVVGSSTAIGYDAVSANSTKMIFLCTGTTDNSAAVTCDLNLDFTGRTAGSLAFNYANILNSSVTSPNGRSSSMVVYYSTDGSTWTSLGGPYTVYNNTGASTANVPVSISLPTALNNQATVKLRFYEYNGGTAAGAPTGSRPKISLDDISVTSTAITTAPLVTSSAATSLGTTAATLNGNVTSDGGSAVTDRGFVYKTSAGATITDNKTAVAGTTGAYTLTPTLAVNTHYYFNAYAINSIGTTLSTPELNFWTLANAPSAPTVNNAQPTSLDVTIASGDGNPAITTYAIREAGGLYVQADGTLGASPVYQTAAAWGTKQVSGLSNSTTYTFDVIAKNGAGTTTVYSSTTSGTTLSGAIPAISTSGSLVAVNTTYGSASASPTSFTASGSNLTADILITPPSGFEVSQTAGGASGYATTQTLTQSGGTVSSTTIYVRLATTTAAGTYSGNITLTSTSASPVNVATVSSTISPKALTVIGLSLPSSTKVYDGTTTATVSGSASLQAAIALASNTSSDGKPITGDTVSLNAGSATGTYNSKDVATATTVNYGGYSLTGASAANYSLNLGSAAATITAKALTMSGLSVPASKTYDTTTTAVVTDAKALATAEAPGAGTTSDGLPYTGDTVSITGTATGTYNNANVVSATTVTYGGLSLTGAQATNYSLTIQSPASATITKATNTITFGALAIKTTSDVPFALTATSTSGLTITYVSGTPATATISGSTVTIVAVGTTLITASDPGNSNYFAATDVSQTLTVASAPCLSSNFDSSTSVPSGWSGTSSNDTTPSHYNSASNCRALGTGINLITSAIDSPNLISFYVDASGSGGQVGTLEYRIGAGTWTTIGTFTASTSGAIVNFALTSSPNLSATSSISFRISSAANTIYIDDLNVYCCTPPSDPTGTISSSVPSCGAATLSYTTGYYWQTTANGTSTSFPTSSNYSLGGTGTMYVRAYNGSCWSTNSLSSGVVTVNSGYYRSAVAGSWATASNWQTSCDNSTNWVTAVAAPDAGAPGITIRSGYNITIPSGSVTADDITIDSGATLTISGGTLILNNGSATTDLQVNGTLTYSSGTFTQNASSSIAFSSTGTYNHAIVASTLTLPVATWDAASTCNVTGINNSSEINGGTTIGQAFGNFIWNNSAETAFMNVENSSFSVAGTLTIGSSTGSLFSLANLISSTYSNTINTIVVNGGQFNGVGNLATTTLTVTNSVSVSSGYFVVSNGSGTSNVTIGTDLLISGTGIVEVIGDATSPSTTLTITRDLLLTGTDSSISLEAFSSTSGVATVNVGRDFSCTAATNYGNVDFGTGTVAGNVINIAGNFTKSGTGGFITTSSSPATGFVFNGSGATQTLSYSGANSNYTAYTVKNLAKVQLNSNLTIGTLTTPTSSFTVASGGTLDFQTYSIIAGNTTDPEFITSSGSTLMSANADGFGGTTTAGSLQNFGTLSSSTSASNGRINLPAGVNYTFNNDGVNPIITTTPFPVPTTSFGNPATVVVNSNVLSNLTSALIVTTAFTVNSGGKFQLNITNNNNLSLNGAVLTVAAGGTFNNGGENQVTNGGGSPSIVISGTFITQDGQGFVGTATSIPGITPVLNAGSTVEYGSSGNQSVQGLTAPTYQNVTFSGSGTKTLASANAVVGTITASGSVIFNAGVHTFGSLTANLTMTGTSEYQAAGTITKPDAGGTYSLGTGTKVSFTNVSASLENIRLINDVSNANVLYYNIDVVGSSVGTTSTTSSIKFQSGGTFTVKNTGTFKFNNTDGFTGSTTTAISNANSPTVTLEATSTVEYAGDNQTVTTFSPYYAFLKFSGTGIKTIPASASANTYIDVNKDLTVTGVTLQVNNNDKNLNLNYNTYLTVTNQFTNSAGTVNFEDGSSLVQVTDGIVNSGSVNYKRITNIRKTDYVYWSTPVASFGVNNIWFTANYIYKWNTTVANSNNGNGDWESASGASMSNGIGYIVRGPSGTSLNSTPSDYPATFAGVPNNGSVSVTIAKGSYTGADYPGTNGTIITNYDDNMNLVGNPYPSAINAHDFLAANANIEGSIQVWTHGTQLSNAIASPYYGSFAYSYTSADYITYDALGASSGPSTFNGYIGAGQAFFVKMLDAAAGTMVTFTNAMRSKGYTNNKFYRIRNPQVTEPTVVDSSPVERHRIWLDLIAPTGTTVRTLVGYIEGATLDKDRMYDAYSDYENDQNFFSLIDKEIMTIQGRPLPFDVNDAVPMGVAIPKTGNYTIAIGAVDGLFEDRQQTIYLEDKLLNVVHNLSASPYTFSIVKGIVKDRFVLRYTNPLGTINFKDLDNSVVVAASKEQIKIKSFIEDIKSITIYDVLGRELYTKDNVNAMEFFVNGIAISQQALIVKMTLANGLTVTKKIVY